MTKNNQPAWEAGWVSLKINIEHSGGEGRGGRGDAGTKGKGLTAKKFINEKER